MTYDDLLTAYLSLSRFAGMNVLSGEDDSTALYELRQGYVYAGAYTASVWLACGKLRAKGLALQSAMKEAQPYTVQMPFPAEVAHELMKQGFEWLLQHEIEPDQTNQADGEIMNEHIPDLRIEEVKQDDGPDLLRIEQIDGGGQSSVIDLHPIHVHYLAEYLGIVDSAHRGAAEEVQALRRRMLVLLNRIAEMDEMLSGGRIQKYTDISDITAHSLATFQLADEFCGDFLEQIEGT